MHVACFASLSTSSGFFRDLASPTSPCAGTDALSASNDLPHQLFRTRPEDEAKEVHRGIQITTVQSGHVRILAMCDCRRACALPSLASKWSTGTCLEGMETSYLKDPAVLAMKIDVGSARSVIAFDPANRSSSGQPGNSSAILECMVSYSFLQLKRLLPNSPEQIQEIRTSHAELSGRRDRDLP